MRVLEFPQRCPRCGARMILVRREGTNCKDSVREVSYELQCSNLACKITYIVAALRIKRCNGYVIVRDVTDSVIDAIKLNNALTRKAGRRLRHISKILSVIPPAPH